MEDVFAWLPIDRIMNNPLNTRNITPDMVTTLASAIQENGWAEPVSVYRRGKDSYMLLAGHRRRAAAVELGLEEMPCLILERPKDRAHEVDLIGLTQYMIEMSPLEMGRSIYTCWLRLNKPPIDSKFASIYKRIKTHRADVSTLKKVVYAFETMPAYVWEKVSSEDVTFASMLLLGDWIRELVDSNGSVLERLSVQDVIEIMVRKMENGFVLPTELKKKGVLGYIEARAIQEFLSHPTFSLSKLLEDAGYTDRNETTRLMGQTLTGMTRNSKLLDGVHAQDMEELTRAKYEIRLTLRELRRHEQRLRGLGFDQPKRPEPGEVRNEIRKLLKSWPSHLGFTGQDMAERLVVYKLTTICTGLSALEAEGVIQVDKSVTPKTFFVKDGAAL